MIFLVIFFSEAYCKLTVHEIYKVCVDQLFTLLVRLSDHTGNQQSQDLGLLSLKTHSTTKR